MIIQTSIRMKDNVVKSATGAVNYILSNFDSSGQKRAVKPEIIHGDPDLIKSLDHHPKMSTKNKSTSGVISLRDGEQLTKEQEELLVQRFQELIIPEQFRDVVDMFLVKHQDKGNVEYHFVIPHLTLEGKKFNPFAVIGRDHGRSAFQSAQAATRILNDEFGFNQVQVNPESKKGLANREIKQQKYSKNDDDIRQIRGKERIASYYIEKVKLGTILNRSELIDRLKADGFSITRNGENYISIKAEGRKAIRLEGGIFANKSEKAYAKLQEQASKADGRSSTIEPYTAEHKARDEQLVKAFHALVVDKYEGKRANMNSLFQEFKQIQNQEIKPVHEPKPESPITAQIEQPTPVVAPTDKPKAHTAPIQAPQPTSPGNPPGQQDQPPAIAGSQGLGGVVVASGEGEAHAAVNAASSDVAAAERDYGINSQQAKNAKANLSKAIQQLQQILARIWKKDAMERKQAQVQGSIAQAPVGPVGLIGPIGPDAPFLGSIKDKISGIKKAPFENIQKKKSKYNI